MKNMKKELTHKLSLHSSDPSRIIEVIDLTKDFGRGIGVFDVTFYVKKGEVYGFLGPNGAGKSTTIRHLMGYYKPDKGVTYINGLESFKEYYKILENVGYLPGEPALPLYYTGNEFIDEMKSLKNVKDTSMIDYLIDYFKVDTNLLCKEMSMGMKRKMAIVVAFMNDPAVLILDEPTSGLDPQMQRKFIEFVKNEKKKGKTILLSSHIFSEVDATCDRISIIKDGRIVSEFEADTLKHASLKKYVVSFEDREKLDIFINNLNKDVIKVIDRNNDSLSLVVTVEDKDIKQLINSIADSQVSSFTEIKETLQDYFMSFYKEEKEFEGVGK